MNTHHMQQSLKGSIAGVVAAVTLLAGGILTVPHAMALEADGQITPEILRTLVWA